jgi:hypothetical protein
MERMSDQMKQQEDQLRQTEEKLKQQEDHKAASGDARLYGCLQHRDARGYASKNQQYTKYP